MGEWVGRQAMRKPPTGTSRAEGKKLKSGGKSDKPCGEEKRVHKDYPDGQAEDETGRLDDGI